MINTVKFKSLRARYEGLMELPIGEPIEVEVWFIQLAAVLDEAIAHGIKLVELCYPIGVGAEGEKS